MPEIADSIPMNMRNGMQRSGSRGRSPPIHHHEALDLPTGGRASSRAVVAKGSMRQADSSPQCWIRLKGVSPLD